MFELGTTKHWWNSARKYPVLSEHVNTLRPLGYAQALNLIEENKFSKVLEIDPGTDSMIFNMLYGSCELWGLQNTMSEYANSNARFEEYVKFHPDLRFFHGLLGESNPQLPQNYFDLIFSVTSIKNVPAERLSKFFEETYMLLRPGGIVFHSYDVYYRQPVRLLFDEYEKAGFEWLKPKETMNVFWEDWLCEPSVELIDSVLPYLMMENPMVVAENYMWQQNREERPSPLNWLTIMTAARKPLS